MIVQRERRFLGMGREETKKQKRQKCRPEPSLSSDRDCCEKDIQAEERVQIVNSVFRCEFPEWEDFVS